MLFLQLQFKRMMSMPILFAFHRNPFNLNFKVAQLVLQVTISLFFVIDGDLEFCFVYREL